MSSFGALVWTNSGRDSERVACALRESGRMAAAYVTEEP
jgi:hypothetical protein